MQASSKLHLFLQTVSQSSILSVRDSIQEVKVMAAAKNLMPSPGNESFKDFIRDSCYYVDKTQYLKTMDLLKNKF